MSTLISFEYVAQECATFYNPQSLQQGALCKPTASKNIAACADGDDFIGVVANTQGGLASVIFHGFVTVTYSGTAPACGLCGLAADGNGAVKVSTSAHKRFVVSFDIMNKTVTILL